MIWAVVFAMAAAQADVVDGVIETLASGSMAQERGETLAVRRAAQALDQVGARPLEPESDPVRRWPRPRATPYRDRVLGPAYVRVQLAPGAAYRVEQSFYGGRQAHVAVMALHSGPAELRLEQDGAGVSCAGAGAGRRASCRWLPLYTGRVVIRIANRGERSDDFLIAMQ